MKDFTIEQGLQVQTRQLNEWKSLLKSKVFEKLKKEVTKDNHLAKDGFDIVRGNSIDNILFNKVLRGL